MQNSGKIERKRKGVIFFFDGTDQVHDKKEQRVRWDAATPPVERPALGRGAERSGACRTSRLLPDPRSGQTTGVGARRAEGCTRTGQGRRLPRGQRRTSGARSPPSTAAVPRRGTRMAPLGSGFEACSTRLWRRWMASRFHSCAWAENWALHVAACARHASMLCVRASVRACSLRERTQVPFQTIDCSSR